MMEETVVLTAIKGFLRRLAKRPMVIHRADLELELEGYIVRIRGINKITIDAVRRKK